MNANKVEIKRLLPEKLSKTDWFAISDLIYGTDDDIFSDFFGDKEVARDIFPALIRKSSGLFSYENIRIAQKVTDIVGVIVFSYNKKFELEIEDGHIESLPKSYNAVKEKYFDGLLAEFSGINDVIYASCISVREDKRRENIGAMLIQEMIQECGYENDIYLDIVASNHPCIKLCTDERLGFGFKIIKTFDDYKKGGTMDLPCKTLFRLKGNSRQEKSLNGSPRKDGLHMPSEFEPHEGCWML